jgi:acyl transferase domain-containing protein/tryptophanase/acyl carrier protein
MIHQEQLRDLTESYLKSLMCEVAGSLSPDFDSLTPFGELGIDSFHVLKIVKRLEGDFGTLPKSLLFENFRINDLADYFVVKHEPTLLAKFAAELNGGAPPSGGVRLATPVRALEPVPAEATNGTLAPSGRGPVRILERDAWAHPELATLVRSLFERYKFEGSASRGTRTIAPNLFIGTERRGYFNYGRSGNIILVYCYTGPEDYLATLREEMYRYCEANAFQLNFLNDGDIEPICGKAFSATPFGAMQRIENLEEFGLDGGPMRRLRYQVSKFQKAGACRTVEYRGGTGAETDQSVVRIIDRWCEGKTMVNPLVQEVRSEILAGTLPSEHRLFLTYLDDVLQNVILITAMSSEINGYLMDLEFYHSDMPLGGLEFAIVEMVAVLAAEGCNVLSLGGTYGCKLAESPTADPELDKFLDDLRARNIFNDESNLQFKNKFRPRTVPIFLCRPVGSGDPENVVDIIMMIADPEKMQTPDADQPAGIAGAPAAATIAPVTRAAIAEESAPGTPVPPVPAQGRGELHLVEGNERERTLAECGFNPLNVPARQVDFDLKTDSWAQLTMPAIVAQMGHLHSQLQQPVSVDDSLRAVFPFTHFVLTASGQAAEHFFFKAWPKKGHAPQNLLFPSTIAHQIDNGFTPVELPHPAIFRLDSEEPHKGNIDLDALQACVARESASIACAIIEVGNNAAGGQAVSTQHLRDVKAMLDAHSIPLVIDGTRVMENAQLLIEQDQEHAGKSPWAVVREIFSHADAVIGSLTKDFCVNKGGIIATNDVKLYQRLQELLHEDSEGLDLIERRMIALSLRNRKHIEAKVARRIEDVRLISAALRARGIPTVHPAGGHCVLIDVKQLPELSRLKEPVASFLAWLYLNTGVRAAAHSVGMQRRTPLNDLVRLAIPVGLKREDVGSIVERLTGAFATMANIPELILESSASQSLGSVPSYRLEKIHNASRTDVAGTGVSAMVAHRSPEPATGSPRPVAPLENVPVEGRSERHTAKPMPRATQDVAVVGMAGRYPKAKNIRELWANLVQGRDCIEEIPAERRERRLQHGSTAKYRGGFIDEVDRFDSLFFNISPREAEMLDPQERLFLEVAWEAIEDAGYYPEILVHDDAKRNIGVFVGAVWAMYQIVGVDEQHAGNEVAPNSFLWSVANRVSYWMNLSGPSLTVDTACSSSLTALYLACEAIQSGECPAAIVGGVNLDLHQAKLNINLIGGALSPDGVCRAFGKGANGYVAGEGVGALLLKPLAQAEQDGDHVYGVIRSVVVNHGGRTSGYFVPNPSAQSSVIAAALQKANVDAASIGYIEAHGTGTELGDPIEISGLLPAFGSGDVGNQTCAIGSIKTNIGHLEAAAGVVSVSKVLLQMQHRQLVPSLHSSELNEHIDFEHSPFYVVQKLEDWKPKEVGDVRLPLRAGISSFGAGGANAHVVLESYEPREPVREEPASATDLIFPLSARNEDQLRETAVRLAEFLRQNRVDLKDVAYTLQQGRKSFEHRVAIVAKTQEGLVEKLAGFIDGKKTEHVAAGHVKLAESVTRLLNRREKQEFVRMLSQGRDPHKIAALWAEGLLADWQGFQWRGRRVSLPTYPFAGKRHWVGDPSAVRRTLQPTVGMHPMVDSNESTFERQLFKKTFTERDFFIHDHLVSEIPTLPGVAYLEFARIAGEIAAGRPVRRIQNILWLSPIAVQRSVPKEVFIELKPSGEVVQFEVFSETDGRKILHSQGKLLYTNRQDGEPEHVDLDAIRARCATEIDGKTAYPLFQSFGLSLGPSFQVLQEVYKSDTEALGVLKLPEFRQGDLQSMVLHPSLVDGSLQAGMTARLSGSVGEMMVPYSIGEVEILHPLQPNCFSYTTEAKNEKKGSRVLKSNVLILDETGRVLARIRESTGVPLLDVHKKDAVDGEGFSRLYYAYEWEKAPLSPDDASRHSPQTILLFDTDETLRDLYRARAASARVILVRPGDGFRQMDEQTWEVDPRSKDDFTRLFESVAEKNLSIDDVCFAWPAAEAGTGISSFLFLCQSLIQAKLEGKVQLLHVGKDAGPQSEAVGGFINTLRAESPKLLCKALELRQEDVLDAVWAEQCARTQDANVVRYQADGRYVRRLKVVELEEAGDASSLRERGVYLITGGAGGLGLIFAEFLARQYKARLVLTGRSKLSAEREAKLDALRESGAEVLYLLSDVSRREDVENLINETRSRFGEINGIIHSAGVVRDSYIRNKTTEEMSAVLAPKVDGTLHLDELTKDERLDFFVMFSSLAAVTGNPGQSDYGFANAFMDSFAAERERLRAAGARSGKSLSVNWSLWADGGMKPDEQTELALKKTLGMRPLSVETGLDAFVRGLASGRSQFAVLEGIREKLDQAWGEKKKTAPLPAPVSASPAAVVDDGGLLAWLQDELTQIVMEFLKLEKSEVATDKVLLDLGFDSIGLATFANAINDKLQLDITPILFFDHPSVAEIARNLSEERRDDLLRFYRGTDATTPAVPAAPQPERREVATFEIRKGWNPGSSETVDRQVPTVSSGGFSPALRFVNQPIAIVGMSGVMPQSEDLEEFWENLRSSKDLVTVIPPDRWRWEDYYGDPLKEPNKSSSKWGGFMKEVDKFDPLFFGISPREAQMMDPQQRIFLEHVWKAVEDSGQKVSDLAGTKTGVFVGVATSDYLSVLTAGGAVLDGYSASGNSHAVLANRASFLLGLRGPSAPLDTACSSSLVAMHRAIESIHTGSSDMAIVGGVHVMLSPAAYISFSSAGMLSPDGKCKTFDKSANGYVRGEGCGAVFIKSLAAAEADGNHIYAVIKATAENHGGRVTALTAPNSAAQAELLIEAYEKGQVDPATVGYIECHGTGTSLGDPIEIQALSKAFSELYKKRGKAPVDTPHCGLSSVKTNIGHLETAAGIAGIFKAVLSIKNQQIPANLHLEEVNPYIKLEGTPFYIADKLTAWKAPVGEDGAPAPRVAGVSSFGFGGANAHVVLQEYIAPGRPLLPVEHEPQLIVLSAKNEKRLDAYMGSMFAYLAKTKVELVDLAYTLQVGRDEMPARVALVVSSTEELRQKLGQVLGGEMPQGCYRGRAGKDAAKTPDDVKDPFRLAELWVAGAKTDWRALYPSGVPRRVSAPTYPFARERHWFAGGEATVGVSRQETASTAVLHPLVHRNSSTFEEQKFSTRFSGEEFFLADHVVETQKILPGVAYLEMARAAGALSANRDVRIIRNLIWEKPLIVGSDAKEVEVSLAPAGSEITFTVRSAAGEGAVTHCTGRLGYDVERPAPERLDIAGIRERCHEQVMSRQELYPFLNSVGLKLGSGFQIVQSIYANESESLAILELPEHLRKSADLFWLHPALMDGSLHTAIGLLKAKGIDAPLGLPYSVDEVQILHSLRDLYYGYATWSFDPEADVDRQKVTFYLLDKDGRVLVRLKDFTTRPLPGAVKASLPKAVVAREELKALLPIWNPVRFDAVTNAPLGGEILLIGGDRAQWEWVRTSCPDAQLLGPASAGGIDRIAEALGERCFEQLVWIAPDVTSPGGDERIIDQQEEGVLTVFRIIKALLQLGYGSRKVQWTIITGRTQRVTELEEIQPAHAGVVGLVGSLAKEYPHWDMRLLDLDSPQSVSARECLSLPWDEQGNALAHRHNEWFRQELALVTTPPETSPVYRQNGVYVVVGGAGGVGEVWSRFMIENYQARVVWIGRQDSNAAIEAKVNALSELGPAPLYISADATDVAALERARESVLELHPTIHGVVHSAIVLRDQSLSRMEESTFRASLAAKVDVSVNLDRVFGNGELDFMLFFSSIISVVKSPGQSNYAAGCTFKDSFAHRLQQQRPYPAKIMNWGYWGNVGVVADESYKKIMRQMGIGSIEPHEGMSSLQVLIGSGLHQLAIMKTIGGQSIPGLDPTEAVAFYPQTTLAVLPQVEPALAG